MQLLDAVMASWHTHLKQDTFCPARMWVLLGNLLPVILGNPLEFGY